jgi:hypothetical protein
MNPSRPRPLPPRNATVISSVPPPPEAPRKRTKGLWITLGLLTLALGGASTFGYFTRAKLLTREASLSSTSAELTDTKTKLGATEQQLASSTEKQRAAEESAKTQAERVKTLEAELSSLKQTAQYTFDQGTRAAVDETDEGDRAAIAKMEEVIDRWPTDPLAEEARKRIEDYQKRTKKRADALLKEQEEVRQQIKRCEAATAGIKASQDKSMVFDEQGELDVTAALAGTRKQEALKKAAAKAKARAKELLQTVADPDGALGKAAEICDVGE